MSEPTADQARYLFLCADLTGHAKHERGYLLSVLHLMVKGAIDAEIDRLMLEFCPEDMSEAQVTEWARHQRSGPQQPIISKWRR